MDDQLWDEWGRHASRFASLWLTSMMSKGKIHFVQAGSGPQADAVRQALEDCPAALKDMPLPAIAIMADGIVISSDDAARQDIATRCAAIPEVMDISWPCPQHDSGIVEWLEQGAPEKPEWTLAQA